MKSSPCWIKNMLQLKCLACLPRSSNPLMIATCCRKRIFMTNYEEQHQQRLPAVELHSSDLQSGLELNPMMLTHMQ